MSGPSNHAEMRAFAERAARGALEAIEISRKDRNMTPIWPLHLVRARALELAVSHLTGDGDTSGEGAAVALAGKYAAFLGNGEVSLVEFDRRVELLRQAVALSGDPSRTCDIAERLLRYVDIGEA